MKKLILWFLMGISSFAYAQNAREYVLEAMNRQQEAWNHGDIEGFMEYYWHSDSLKFIGSKGITYGWAQTLLNYRKSYPDRETMGKLTFAVIEISELDPSNIFVIGKWQLEKEKPAGGHFTLLWKLISGHWVIVTDHTS
jgi:hypothetical protein